MLNKFKDQNILLLQGPLGPFFWRFAKELQSKGSTVFKINLCGGDNLFFPSSKATSYKDTLKQWPNFLSKHILHNKIDALFLLGDFRPYHDAAKTVAHDLNVKVFVFEEGYLRPDFITLEEDGVNGNSTMSRDPEFFRQAALLPKENIQQVGSSFWHSAFYTAAYYTAMAVTKAKYPNYRHHRPSNLAMHTGSWLRGAARKVLYKYSEADIYTKLTTYYSNKFFLFPLQVHNDFQFKHSKFSCIEECIEQAVMSFAKYANKDEYLVFKHHPADRPYRDYAEYLNSLKYKYNLHKRILYVHDLHLPTLLQHARGTVLMNSTVGLSSIHHNTPVKVMGRAVYNISGLTFQKSLNDFWINPGDIDTQLYEYYRGWLEHHSQINGNFYKRLNDGLNNKVNKNDSKKTGINWTVND